MAICGAPPPLASGGSVTCAPLGWSGVWFFCSGILCLLIDPVKCVEVARWVARPAPTSRRGYVQINLPARETPQWQQRPMLRRGRSLRASRRRPQTLRHDGRAAAACPGPRRGTHEWHFNWNHFHRKAAAGATLETGMRATAEGTYYVPSVKPRRFCCFHRGQRHSL